MFSSICQKHLKTLFNCFKVHVVEIGANLGDCSVWLAAALLQKTTRPVKITHRQLGLLTHRKYRDLFLFCPYHGSIVLPKCESLARCKKPPANACEWVCQFLCIDILSSFHRCAAIVPNWFWTMHEGRDIETVGTRKKPKDHYFDDVLLSLLPWQKVFQCVWMRTYFDASEAKRMQAVPGLRRIKAGWVWKKRSNGVKFTGSRES